MLCARNKLIFIDHRLFVGNFNRDSYSKVMITTRRVDSKLVNLLLSDELSLLKLFVISDSQIVAWAALRHNDVRRLTFGRAGYGSWNWWVGLALLRQVVKDTLSLDKLRLSQARFKKGARLSIFKINNRYPVTIGSLTRCLVPYRISCPVWFPLQHVFCLPLN